jgi:hypothetical protein
MCYNGLHNAGGFMLDVKFSDIELKAYKKMLANAPKYYQAVTANVLNDLAFDMREILQGQISGSMVMRNRGLLKKFTRVEKAKPGPVSQQRAVVGTLRSKDFTGWAENEKGGPSERNRVITLMARGGDKAKIVPKKNRINQEIAHDAGNFGSTAGNRTMGFLSWLNRNSYKGLFQLSAGKFKGGIYTFKPGQPAKMKGYPIFYKVQQPNERMQVRANPVMDHSRSKLFSTGTMQNRWDKALKTAIDRMVKVHGGEL